MRIEKLKVKMLTENIDSLLITDMKIFLFDRIFWNRGYSFFDPKAQYFYDRQSLQ